MWILGVDPGASGAVAAIEKSGPDYWVRDLGGDPSLIANAFREIFSVSGADRIAALEQVHAMPGQGVTSMFSFGASYGACRGILAYACVPYHLVTPSKWKKDLGLGKDKDEALAMARRLFPTAELSRKKDIGRAEALLIAEWARRFVVKP